MAKKLLFTSGIAFCLACVGALASGGSGFGKIIGKPEKGQLPKSLLVVSGIEVGRSKLSDVTAKMGVPSGFSETQSGRVAYACVRSDDDKAEIHFESSILGGWENVTSVVIATPGFFLDRRCHPSKNSLKDNLQGLRLGMSQSRTIKIIGVKPTYRDKERLEAAFESPVSFASKGEVREGVRSSGFIGIFSKDQLKAFSVFSVEAF